MKILCLADEESKYYWDYFKREKLADVDLILACGDLKAEYLTFLVTMGHAPLFYVCGNHDESYASRPPEGCDCIENRVVEFRGLRIAGLGGSMRYRPGLYQYTEQEMARRIRRMRWQLRKGVDIVVTHAPVAGFGDLPDLTHRGFDAFRGMIEKYRPAYLLHGHVHANYRHELQREYDYCGTRILNVGESFLLKLPDGPLGNGGKANA